MEPRSSVFNAAHQLCSMRHTGSALELAVNHRPSSRPARRALCSIAHIGFASAVAPNHLSSRPARRALARPAAEGSAFGFSKPFPKISTERDRFSPVPAGLTAPQAATRSCSRVCHLSHVSAGGGVWKSNPPFDPRRTESPALKTGKVTGPLSPPFCKLSQSRRSL
jgi:hypothetical protein